MPPMFSQQIVSEERIIQNGINLSKEHLFKNINERINNIKSEILDKTYAISLHFDDKNEETNETTLETKVPEENIETIENSVFHQDDYFNETKSIERGIILLIM
jgi:hypothetical protein